MFISCAGFSKPLKEMLQNQHLRVMLTELDQSEDPIRLLKKAMQIPIFVEFAEECLSICGFRNA